MSKNLEIDLPIESSCKALIMLWVKPGTFQMGESCDPNFFQGDDSFEMTLSSGYWLGKFPVTQAQWQAVMGNNPSHFQGKNLPVEKVNWHEALAFCKKLKWCSSRSSTDSRSSSQMLISLDMTSG